MTAPKTMFEKIWDRHAILTLDDATLLYVDRGLLHEGARHSFTQLAEQGRAVRKPRQILACMDHYIPSAGRDKPLEEVLPPDSVQMILDFEANTAKHGLIPFGRGDERQGITHVVGPEQGLTLPGMVIGGGDSHSSTHGAFGTLAMGIGSSEVTHVLATQTLWERKQKPFRIRIEGARPFGVSAKDVILTIMAEIGAGGAGHVIEYAGSTVRAMTMDERMTVCNMSIEGGARAGMIAPDEVTYDYLHGRPFAPAGAEWDRALASWKTLPSDDEARFAKELTLEASDIAPMVSWGTNPSQSLPVTDRVPDPVEAPDAAARADIETALAYMNLAPGTPLEGIPVDIVFIGSCTNSRLDDLRAAAEVARKGRARVPAWVVPGSTQVKRAAEAEGLDRVFADAGFEWRDSACSLCTAINGVDVLAPGQRCASTSNRNYQGRQGRGARTHLVSPAMAAAAAITGRITDVRKL